MQQYAFGGRALTRTCWGELTALTQTLQLDIGVFPSTRWERKGGEGCKEEGSGEVEVGGVVAGGE